MILLALALAAAEPAKLIIVYGDATPAVVPYPSMSRCERARQSLVAQAEKRDPSRQTLPSGIVVIRRGVAAYCVPG